jgi:hypothetical protein
LVHQLKISSFFSPLAAGAVVAAAAGAVVAAAAGAVVAAAAGAVVAAAAGAVVAPPPVVGAVPPQAARIVASIARRPRIFSQRLAYDMGNPTFLRIVSKGYREN